MTNRIAFYDFSLEQANKIIDELIFKDEKLFWNFYNNREE